MSTHSAGSHLPHSAPPGFIARSILFRAVPSWLVSMVVHVLLILILALVTIGPKPHDLLQEFTMSSDTVHQEQPLNDALDIELPPLALEVQPITSTDFSPTEPAPLEPNLQTEAEAPSEPTVAALLPIIDDFEKIDDIYQLPNHNGSNTPYARRSSPETRRQIAIEGGGSPKSEQAVERALKWIVSRQAADGGWNFNHNLSANPRRCPDPGTADAARNGPTGIALLPLLGAGQTHKEGVYRKQIQAGLAYLVQHMKVSGRSGSWHEADGNMYSHGLASIAVCEAYAMTHDKELVAPAQLAINYIVEAQDPVGGGWRYAPRQAGDTSVVGWQIMALKSGHMAYLLVPKGTINGASKFLDSVQANSGAAYGYTAPAEGRDATSSIGLLCRMYLGWKHENPALIRGVETIDQRGPSASDMYYNYYATQVCHQFGGPTWKRWNDRMHDALVKSQVTEGASAGSWHMAGGHANERGGRLYCTAMATMMLEVYYRQMPLYRQQAADDDFAL